MIDKIIFDTDMDTDCDDAAALQMLIKAHFKKEIELIGVVCDSPSDYAAPACDAICSYYGLDVPIATYVENECDKNTRFLKYHGHQNEMSDYMKYTHFLAKMVERKDYTSSTELYLKLLSDAADNSVVIVCVGLMSAVCGLFETPDGIELVKNKVKYIVSMTNAPYPSSNNSFNYDMDGYAAEFVCKNCPVPIYASPDGTRVITGYSYSSKLKNDHPLRIAYEHHNLGEGVGRSSWDLITTLFALDPNSPMFKVNSRGKLCYDMSQKRTYWNDSEVEKDFEVRMACSTEEMTLFLENMLIEGE